MTRRLRVVHISGCLEMGGQEKLLVEFAKHADRDRFELRFLSLETRGLLADEIEAHGWPVETLDLSPGLHLRMPLRLAKLLRRWQADIVHTHNERPLIYGVPAARLARVAGVVHTKHGRGVRNSRRQNWLTSIAARLTDQFVCVSDDSARLALEQGVPSSRIHTLHNGIDTRRFEACSRAGQGEKSAVVVARLCAEKDLATLLHAVALVVREAPEFRLAIAGAGPEISALRQLSQQLHIADHVDFLGLVRDVTAVLREARLFVLSSISEGVPLTLLEAMASGLPCVATRVGGIPEVLEDGVTGFLVPPREPPALAAALLRVHGDDELARQFGLAARRHVEVNFDVRQMVARYERIYETVGGHVRGMDSATAEPPSPPIPLPEGEGNIGVANREVHGCASHI